MEDKKREIPLCLKHGSAGMGKSHFYAVALSSIFIIKKKESLSKATASQEVK
ncbi:hypothetical protein [Endozoicomonas atrinae]|uniref:hypothetical protein n=1 Tax=Endozoicomonas atrinae TaxID=1333660 RepID=UPI000ACF4AD0|nr:hypothetical protein [Endozoicomonas atrinae]